MNLTHFPWHSLRAWVTSFTKNQLRESEHKLSEILENVDAYIYLKDTQGRYLFANRPVRELFGVSMAEITGRGDERFFDTESAAQIRHNDHQVLAEGKTLKTEESNCNLRTGQTSTYLSVKLPLRNETGEIYALCGISTDITERKQLEMELRIAATAFDSQEAMIITDANKVILRANRAFTEVTGYSSADVVGKTPSQFKSGRHDAAFYQKMWQSINDTGGWQGEVWDRRKNGELYPKWLTISAVKNDAGVVTHYIGAQHDISERKQAEQEIQKLAFYDSLTQLPNRALLLDRLKHAMTVCSRNETCGAVLFIDLDYFKTLNDTLGHDKGDKLLQQAAQRLTLCVREEDTVARLGGDEFVVLLENLSKNADEAATQTEAIGEKMLAALGQKYLLGDVDYYGTASMGASLFCGHAVVIEDLLKQADLAMYQAKDRGRNTLCFFDPAMQTVIMARAALEHGLRRALEESQFLLYYQAQVVGDGYATGAEVLIRWQHPERGLVHPAEFILFAEETGLILALGHWVLETACLQLAKWAVRPDMAHLTLAVNVSAHQFHQHDFVEQVLAVLENTGANSQRLKLELTESLLVNNIAEIIEKMFMLKAKGIGFSLDDFGTGYSSLAYLKRLPLDQLKIDHSFVQEVLTDPNDAAIAKTIVALAQSLGLGVIAEGVETAAQCHFMATSGCHAYQGYFFSRPLPVDAFEAYVARATARRLQADAGG